MEKKMYRYEDVRLREFTFDDIPKKIEWINNSANNKYLNYDIPLEYDKTCRWFETLKDRKDRYDFVVEYKDEPVGLFGLLNIDYKNKTAFDYSLIGETTYKGLGIGTKAGILNFIFAYNVLELNKISGKIEVGNEPSLKRWLKSGGHVEGYLRDDRWRNGEPIDAYMVAHYRKDFILPQDVIVDEKFTFIDKNK